MTQRLYMRHLRRKRFTLSNSTSINSILSTPLRKIAIPSDVAHQIVILASPIVSGHVTGQVVMVEGGMEGRLLNRREQMLRVVKLEESMVE